MLEDTWFSYTCVEENIFTNDDIYKSYYKKYNYYYYYAKRWTLKHLAY